jgi:hypothetical protein
MDTGEYMSKYAGQDNGTLRVTIREAASRLGVTEAAIRKRIQRGSLNKEMGEDGRVYVYLDMSQDMSNLESQVDHEPLVDELRDRVRFLERELDRRSIEAERYQQIVAGLATANVNLTDRLKELEAPTREPAASQAHEEAAEGPSPGGEGEVVPAPAEREPQSRSEGVRKPWYKRWFT